ncbi:restriction endonuclease subunit R [Erysipelatoclostridium sp. An173]|uniref:type I restriction endonuclease subunit R n=1 Tax=Erysipelatoclostridium sp. An173 TaxID=1965571 RepID=UPI000B39E6F3|nr:DEAD/DEAH box helicase family protein [Erysipelatoclostridium sp. An173]OUP72998.1 restriction endonuclease subunit R [Erysipelatoclostridium sp. An173]
MDKSEKRFERDIESFLISPKGGYQQFVGQDKNGKWVHNRQHDVNKAIYLDVLIEFIQKSQPKEWERYKKYYGDQATEKLYRRLETAITNQGLIYVLRNGIEDMGVKLKVCYFKPESVLNDDLDFLYNSNILGCTRQFNYSPINHNTIDMVLSVNGIPVVALELKNQLTGQNYECGISQYKNDRSSKEFCFRLNHRFLVYFAVDLYEAWMTTQLKDGGTYFMPFNQGSNGAGNTGGAGNPTNPNGYATSYLWEEVLQKDSLLDIIHRFISFVTEKEEVEKNGITKTIKKEKLIFPRYHQYDVVKKVMSDVKINGAGQNYLIQHSAGSGKSNSIAWIAYRLASIHDDENNPIFNSVIVVTNRVVLDSQLQDTINSFDHKKGLVEAIDDKKRSKGLADALNDKKRIIICTIQKFLFAYKDLDKMSGSKFAIIIDEAHQGQSGESAKTLRRSLIDLDKVIEQYAKEEGIDPSLVDLNNDFISALLGQGRHENQSFFAFTATPKPKTLELFGRYDSTLKKYVPFHIYSMRQAIEERFILDVLSNYTTIKEAFRLIRVSADNPELIEGAAAKALFKYYKEHGYTIQQKTEMIMSNFLNNGRFKINGKGKAMVIADSRANAVRYYFAIKEYLKNHPHEGSGSDVMVAFSGTVKLDGIEYTEADLNQDEKGRNITTDKKFRKVFRSDKYNILVVARKYQTGFDEPLLHSMYVDTKLKDVTAVQTLSRLNRTASGKNDTFVLDFENTEEDIKKSFQTFYEATYLDGQTDINSIYDYRNKIKNYMLYDWDDVSTFKNFMLSQKSNKQTSTSLGKLSSIFKPIIERFNELEEDDRYTARDYIRKFNRAYSYITQLVRLHDEDLFDEFLYTSNLVRLLPSNEKIFIDIDDKIKLEYASLKETFKGAIILEKKSIDVSASQSIAPKKPDKKKDTLQSIIDKVNERFDGDFTDGDKVIIEGIYQMFMNDSDVKKFKKYAKDNNPEMFINSLFPDKFNDIVTKCFLENNYSFEKLFNDPDFYQKVRDAMANELYKSLRKS